MIKKIGSVNGLLLGMISIFGAFLIEGGSLRALFLLAPILIVFGGTFAAVIIGFGLDNFKNILQLIKLAYFPRTYNLQRLIDNYFRFSINF